MAKKKSLVQQALDQGKTAGIAAGGYLAAGQLADLAEEQLGSESIMKRLGAQVAAPAAAGLAVQRLSTNKMVKTAGLGMFVRAGVGLGQIAWDKASNMTGSDDSGSDVSGRSREIARQRARRRQLPAAQKQRTFNTNGQSGRSGIMAPGAYSSDGSASRRSRRSAGFQRV